MRNLEKAFSMENAVSNSTWNPIATASDIDAAVVDSLKALDPERPIREVGGPAK
jgi:hypothetical protein